MFTVVFIWLLPEQAQAQTLFLYRSIVTLFLSKPLLECSLFSSSFCTNSLTLYTQTLFWFARCLVLVSHVFPANVWEKVQRLLMAPSVESSSYVIKDGLHLDA